MMRMGLLLVVIALMSRPLTCEENDVSFNEEPQQHEVNDEPENDSNKKQNIPRICSEDLPTLSVHDIILDS